MARTADEPRGAAGVDADIPDYSDTGSDVKASF